MPNTKAKSFLSLIVTMAVGSTALAASTPNAEAILENSPVSCFYMLMHSYRQQMNICGMPLDQVREERFSRMSEAIEDYIRNHARLDPEAIISNARGAAEHAGETFPTQTLDLSDQILGPTERAVRDVPFCESERFNSLRQAMLDFTTADAEAELYAQLETGLPVANGSCY